MIRRVVDVTVVVVAFNVQAFLKQCLRSALAAAEGLSLELWVVDNASEDGSRRIVAEEFPQVLLLGNTRNVGFAAANNQALRRASGRYCLLLNPDTRVLPGAIRELVSFMDRHAKAGFCGPKLLNADRSHQPSARRFPTPWSYMLAMSGGADRFPRSRHCIDLGLGPECVGPRRADWLSGACLMVRAEAMKEVGVLDERFFMYFEETEWCRRMGVSGWEGWYVPDAEVVHYGGGSIGSRGEEASFFGNHPEHWVPSRRLYMRLQHGVAGMLACDACDLLLQSLIWVKHRLRRRSESRRKASRAAEGMRWLLRRQPLKKRMSVQ